MTLAVGAPVTVTLGRHGWTVSGGVLQVRESRVLVRLAWPHALVWINADRVMLEAEV